MQWRKTYNFIALIICTREFCSQSFVWNLTFKTSTDTTEVIHIYTTTNRISKEFESVTLLQYRLKDKVVDKWWAVLDTCLELLRTCSENGRQRIMLINGLLKNLVCYQGSLAIVYFGKKISLMDVFNSCRDNVDNFACYFWQVIKSVG